MIETNIKIVNSGANLSLTVKRVKLEGECLDAKQIRTVCSILGKRYGVVATPILGQENQEILIPYWCYFPEKHFSVEGWLITPKILREGIELRFSELKQRKYIADLYKQSLIVNVQRNGNFWALENESSRIFYEKTPFYTGWEDGFSVDAFRRFEISEMDINGVGLGLPIEISTGFFANTSVADFHENGRENEFARISLRQKEQQGTLMYATPKSRTVCYFEKYLYGKTLATARGVEVKGKYYSSPYEYYEVNYPQFRVSPDDKVAIVSFRNMDKKVPVAAKMLFARVMNSALPWQLSNLSAIAPQERKDYLETKFWKTLGEHPFGEKMAAVGKPYYAPPREKCGIVNLPDILFGQEKVLKAPQQRNRQEYKTNFRQRKEYLEKYGCFHVPPFLDGSELFFVMPDNIPNAVVRQYQANMTDKIKTYTKMEVEPVVVPYSQYMEGVYRLKNDYEPGTVVFIFDDEDPAVYSQIDFELNGWVLKRATKAELLYKYKKLQRNQDNGRDWNSYIEMTALDVIQQMGCIPYAVSPERFNYDMHLVIDVSEERSHIAVSLQIWKKGMSVPLFPCRVKRNVNNKETINPIVLQGILTELFEQNANEIKRYNIKNMLVLRDGNDCKAEFEAIFKTVEELKKKVFSNDFAFDFVEYRKSTRKSLRIWDSNQWNRSSVNVLEGSYFSSGGDTMALAATGEGTLSQGTADPVVIVGKYTNPNLIQVVEDVFLSSQFNFSNPSKAQRLTLIAKRADEQLQEKRAQEVKRIS